MKPHKPDRRQFFATALLVCLAAAVLAFGGTEPLSWAAVQLGAFLLFGLVVMRKEAWHCEAQLPWKGPALLLGYALVQTAVVQPPVYLAREHILRLLAYLSIFYVSAFVCAKQESRRLLIFGIIALGVFEALYGLAQYLSGWQQIFTYKKIFYTAHATGTYINPNHFAGLLEMTLPLCFARALYSLERITPRADDSARFSAPRASGEAVTPLVFFFFSTLLLFAAILFSRSRAGILSAAASLIASTVLWRFSRQRSRAALVSGCVLAGACLFGLWIGLRPVLERYETLETDYGSRLAVWKDSLVLIRQHTFWGSGPGPFIDVYTRAQSTLLSRIVDHAHNDYLELAVEWGIAGATILVGLILLVLGRAVWVCLRLSPFADRSIPLGSCGSILALLLHSFADFNLQIPANALMLSVILGVAYSSRPASGGKRSAEKTMSGVEKSHPQAARTSDTDLVSAR